jgi:hypothetical protein
MPIIALCLGNTTLDYLVSLGIRWIKRFCVTFDRCSAEISDPVAQVAPGGQVPADSRSTNHGYRQLQRLQYLLPQRHWIFSVSGSSDRITEPLGFDWMTEWNGERTVSVMQRMSHRMPCGIRADSFLVCQRCCCCSIQLQWQHHGNRRQRMRLYCDACISYEANHDEHTSPLIRVTRWTTDLTDVLLAWCMPSDNTN